VNVQEHVVNQISEEINYPRPIIPLYVVSGGAGSLGEQVARTVLAQFDNAQVQFKIFSRILTRKPLRKILNQAEEEKAIVVHSFVDAKLRKFVKKYQKDHVLRAIDLLGELITALTKELGQEPLGKPGLYRELHKSYFDRIDAINFTIDHDDGKNPEGWKNAEIVLIGVSRVGKTPLSLYLSMLGWKVANIPLVYGIPPRQELFEVDSRRIVGLKIDPSELLRHREHRQHGLGVGFNKADYVDPVKVFEETEAVEKFIRRSGFRMVEITDKPIETSASEVTRIVQNNLKRKI
jgi:[pyruvate, water dikinase]-phosphate phosphotransferase / [pyruvate, water dikinase] kinase